ncbi:MAG: NAD(P)-binding domain-containing protein, partial [Phycisphaerales bacterium]|nr:NAD(P)-binding domain-containing protein [Phycisphaerales bacterium]
MRDTITNTKAVVGIVGMGYVGFPLGVAVERARFRVVGYDLDPNKVNDMSLGHSYLGEGWTETFQHMAASDRFAATSDPGALANCDLVILCVPTPLDEAREPDLTCVIESTKMVASFLRPGQLVILESTTWPGTSREVMLPILESTGLSHGEDFLLAYSPERENPGDPVFHTA